MNKKTDPLKETDDLTDSPNFEGIDFIEQDDRDYDSPLSKRELRELGAWATTHQMDHDPYSEGVAEVIQLSGVARGYHQQSPGEANDPNRY